MNIQQNHSHKNCQHTKHHNNKVEHLISLFQTKFINPYKLIYMVDQKQADYFKIRNKQIGCCSSNLITIKRQQQTKLQKIVQQIISRGFLLIHLENILIFCNDRYFNIKNNGKGLEFNQDVQKYLLNQVLIQGVTLYLFKQITKKISQESISVNGELGLWATPSTWYNKYPNVSLNSLNGTGLKKLDMLGFSIFENYFIQEKENLTNQLLLLEKDGRFQEILWKNSNRNDTKILTNPQLYLQQSNTAIKYPKLKSSMLLLKSIPFQLNEKMNNYCTISETIHISYFHDGGYQKYQKQESSKYSIIAVIGDSYQFNVLRKRDQIEQKNNFKEGDLIIVDNQKIDFGFELKPGKKYFVLRTWVYTTRKI